MLFVDIVALFLSFVLCCHAVKVKVNDDRILEVPTRLEANDIKDIKVTTLDFIRHKTWKEPLLKVENFDDLQRMSVDNIGLILLPAFEDLPQLRELSIQNNAIRRVYTSHFHFVEITKLSLANNFIDSISASAFNRELNELNVKCNELKEVSVTWFPNPENLLVLDVSNNKIQSIKQKTFGRFTKLTQLNLSGNKISTIETFSLTFESMHKLDLSMNLISDLNPSIFIKNSVEINTFNITYNKLNFLRESFVNKIYGDTSGTREISVFGNPWQCYCLRKLEMLLMQYNIVQNEPEESHVNAKCISSLTYPKTCEEVMEPELFETYSKHVLRNKTACSKPDSITSAMFLTA